MSEREESIAKIATAITKMFMNEGRIVEMGFRLYLLHSFTAANEVPIGMVPQGMPKDQYEMLRTAFFAGSQHLFGSLMTGLDEDREPTEDDMKKMALIDSELQQFIEDYKKKHNL